MNIKKLSIMVLAAGLFILTAVPVQAVPTIQFAEDTGSWVYKPYGQGHGLLTFTPNIVVTKGEDGSAKDTLRGAKVNLPSMKVNSYSNGEFKLTPTNGGKFSITDATGNTTYLTGTLGTGNLVPAGTTAGCFTIFQSDITGITINNSINSEALKRISELGSNPALDLDLSLNGSKPGFKNMIDSGQTGSDGISGSCTVVPAPGAILLGSLGVGIVGWLRRRRTL